MKPRRDDEQAVENRLEPQPPMKPLRTGWWFAAVLRFWNVWHRARVLRQGPRHRITWRTARAPGTRIEFYGDGGSIELGHEVRLFDCIIVLRGTRPRLVIQDRVRLTQVRIVVEDEGSEVLIKSLTSMTRATVQSKEGCRVEFGADCMVGHGAEVTNSDSHSVICQATGARLNPARDVVLGDRVWLGAGVYVTKGVRIGPDTVVAAGSRVFSDLPGAVLAAGVPAVVKRTGVAWCRERLGVKP